MRLWIWVDQIGIPKGKLRVRKNGRLLSLQTKSFVEAF
jgi:hypothetical protein